MLGFINKSAWPAMTQLLAAENSGINKQEQLDADSPYTNRS
uniref:Uncharacterized protein n=1 Tax=Pseudomonas fluorescens (strain SBW25) TaxID=216595 RepID=A0A0G4E468_PSEFS|nr:hypothetical protein PQBR57_0016 [Pseudomonas fluorescens SBW25]